LFFGIYCTGGLLLSGDVCSNCFTPVGQGIADRTLDIYDAVLCVDCGVLKGKAIREAVELELLLEAEGD
jgi:hypothetical protein